MSGSSPENHNPAPELKNQKSLRALLKHANDPNLSKSHPDLYNYLYVDRFNANIVNMQESEYKSRNSKLFTWKQITQYPERLQSPPSLTKKITKLNINFKSFVNENEGSRISPVNINQAGASNTEQTPNQAKVIKLHKKNLSETQKDFHGTFSGTFKTQELRSQTNTPVATPFEKVRKSYSLSKVQTDILRNGSPTTPVDNFQYMTNQFDRKNQTLNRILHKINTHEEMLDRQEVEEEIIHKLKYISKGQKLQKFLKPKTASNSMIRGKPGISIIAKTPKDDVFYSQANSPMSFSPKPMKSFKLSKEAPDFERMLSSSTASPGVFRFGWMAKDEDESPLQLINKQDLRKVIKKVKKFKTVEKDTKTFSQKIESVGVKTQESEGFPDKRDIHTPKLLVRVQTNHLPFRRKPTVISTTTSQQSEKQYRESTPLADMPIDDDNIFNFGHYFKKRYLEKGHHLQISTELLNRINNLEKNIGNSAKNITRMSKSAYQNFS